MEIEVEAGKLAKALGVVSRVAAGSKTTLPILNNILIRVDEGRVSLTVTNLDMAVVDYLAVKECRNGVITVPAKLLAEFVANLPRGEMVKMKCEGARVTVKAGKYSSVLNGVVADDFPELPEISEEEAVKLRIAVDEFKVGVGQVMIASSNDMTRPALTGVFFNTAEGSLYVAATDGYRLAERKLDVKTEAEVRAIVPTGSLAEVLRSISDGVEEVEVWFSATQVKFVLGEVEIMSKLIDGSFPDYRQLIPKESEEELVLDKAELIRGVKLAALFAREVGGSVVLEAKTATGTFSVGAVANEYGENSSEIETEVKKDERITLNSRFLIDALNALVGEKVKLGFTGKLAPIIVKNEVSTNYVHIIMPLKS